MPFRSLTSAAVILLGLSLAACAHREPGNSAHAMMSPADSECMMRNHNETAPGNEERMKCNRDEKRGRGNAMANRKMMGMGKDARPEQGRNEDHADHRP